MLKDVRVRARCRVVELVEARSGFEGVAGNMHSNRKLPGASTARHDKGATKKLTCAIT